jgi:hypothetical protein
VDRPAERAGLPEPDLIEQDEDHVGGPFGALTSKRGGALALRTSSSVMGAVLGSGMGKTVWPSLTPRPGQAPG